MDSTTAWNGEMLRLTMVCRARIIEASASMGPVPFCGYPAWVPWACSVTLNFTQPAIIGCGPMAICPGA